MLRGGVHKVAKMRGEGRREARNDGARPTKVGASKDCRGRDGAKVRGWGWGWERYPKSWGDVHEGGGALFREGRGGRVHALGGWSS